MSRGWVRKCVTVVAVAVLRGVWGSPAGAAALSCSDPEVGKIAQDESGLHVVEAATPSVRRGDRLLQLNGHRLQTCSDLEAAARAARQEQLARLFLIRRGEQTVAVAFEVQAEQLATAPAVVAPAIVSAAPSVAPSTALPATIPPSALPTVVPTPPSGPAADTARRLLAEFVAFGRELQGRQPLPMAQPWAQRVEQLRQQYNSQHARGAAVGVVEPILEYYETVADILRYKETATRERRDVRARSEVVLEYHSNAPVAAWLQRYPFLRPSVIQEPETIRFIDVGESNGQWLPDRAVALLLDRAVSEGTALSATLAAGSSR